MDFRLNGAEVGTRAQGLPEEKTSEVDLAAQATVHLTVKAAAMLDAVPHPEIHNLPVDQKPYFHIERARIHGFTVMQVELIVNRQAGWLTRRPFLPMVRRAIFPSTCPIEKSIGPAGFWGPSAAPTPVFVVVAASPRVARSAEWCLAAVGPSTKGAANVES